MTHFYATQLSEFYLWESKVHRFGSRAERDQWVADNQKQYGRAYALTAREARRRDTAEDKARWKFIEDGGPAKWIDCLALLRRSKSALEWRAHHGHNYSCPRHPEALSNDLPCRCGYVLHGRLLEDVNKMMTAAGFPADFPAESPAE